MNEVKVMFITADEKNLFSCKSESVGRFGNGRVSARSSNSSSEIKPPRSPNTGGGGGD